MFDVAALVINHNNIIAIFSTLIVSPFISILYNLHINLILNASGAKHHSSTASSDG